VTIVDWKFRVVRTPEVLGGDSTTAQKKLRGGVWCVPLSSMLEIKSLEHTKHR
jgi:hypothetical protein